MRIRRSISHYTRSCLPLLHPNIQFGNPAEAGSGWTNQGRKVREEQEKSSGQLSLSQSIDDAVLGVDLLAQTKVVAARCLGNYKTDGPWGAKLLWSGFSLNP